MHQRAAAVPVLAGRLRVKNFGGRAAGARTFENAVGFAGEWVGRVAVGERKIVGRIKMLLVLAIGARWRGKAVVEIAQAAAGHVRDHAVEHLPRALVGVESLPEKVAQAASALGGAKADGLLDERLAVAREQRVP